MFHHSYFWGVASTVILFSFLCGEVCYWAWQLIAETDLQTEHALHIQNCLPNTLLATDVAVSRIAQIRPADLGVYMDR